MTSCCFLQSDAVAFFFLNWTKSELWLKGPLYPSDAFLPCLIRLLYHFIAEKKDTIWVASFLRITRVKAVKYSLCVYQNVNNF